MKIIKTASNYEVKMSEKEWLSIGEKAGWLKVADDRTRRVSLLNRDINAFTTNKYFPSIPLRELGELCTKNGFNASELEGIYTGRDGRESAHIGENVYLIMTWHKMESGNYEIVAYASAGKKPAKNDPRLQVQKDWTGQQSQSPPPNAVVNPAKGQYTFNGATEDDYNQLRKLI